MGNLLGAPITTKETKSGKTSEGLSYGLSSMQGWRIHMEDAHICETELYAEHFDKSDDSDPGNSTPIRIPLPKTSLFAVFDGHAGTFAAEFAEKNFFTVLSRQPPFVKYAQITKSRDLMIANSSMHTAEINHTSDTQNHNIKRETEEEAAAKDRELLELLEEALCNTFLELDSLLYSTVSSASSIPNNEDMGIAMSERAETNRISMGDDSGTTAVVVLLTPRWIVCANAGDSRAIYSKSNGRAIPLSYDHKPDDDGEEQRIFEAGGFVTSGRVDGDLAVSRGLGDFRLKSNLEKSQVQQRVSPMPDIIVQNRDHTNDEFIVLACDGLWDVASNKKCIKMIHDIFKEGESELSLVCEEMLDLSLRKGSKDNISCLIVQLPGLKIGTGGGVLARRKKLEEDQLALQQHQQQQQQQQQQQHQKPLD